MRLYLAEFFCGARLREIERGMADMRETLAVLSAQTPLMVENARSMADLVQRVAALESQMDIDREAVREIAGGALASGTQMEVQGEELVRLRTSLSRLERQLNAEAEEARKVATGLLERMEQARFGVVGVERSAAGSDTEVPRSG